VTSGFSIAMAEPADINVDELRRRARRRLVGAVVLALGVAVVVPMLLETEQKPLGEDVAVRIPPVDDSKFVNRLSENRAKDAANAASKPAPPSKDDAPKDAAAKDAASPPSSPTAGAERSSKYDTRIPDASSGQRPAGGTATRVEPDSSASAAGRVPDAKSPPPSASSIASDAPKPSPSVQAQPPVEITPIPPPANAKPATPAPGRAAGAPKAAAPATPHDGFAVQLAAFADDKGANALAGRLKKVGYAAYIEPLKTSKGTLWRVRVGPYPSREAAVAARDKLKIEGQSGIVAAVK
jgi:DedD protein